MKPLSKDFSPSTPPPGRLVRSRFSLRRESKTRAKVVEAPDTQTPFSYSNPGRGANGESSN